MSEQDGDLLAQLVRALAAGRLRVVDLTQPLNADTQILALPPQWPNTPRFTLHEIARYDDRGPFWYWNWFETGEHTGTHFDAPVHWASGRDLPNSAVDTIPPTQFIAPACVIDVTADAERNADFLLTVERVQQWEDQHGRIPAGSWVLLRTGWATREGAAYLNADESGGHTPGWSCECSLFLAEERDVIGVGVETVGTDAGQAHTFNPPFCNHFTMHGHGKFGLASLCNLDQLPPTGAVLFAAPLKIAGGSGSPLRVLAITP
jgi:kynurenine formamidase